MSSNLSERVARAIRDDLFVGQGKKDGKRLWYVREADDVGCDDVFVPLSSGYETEKEAEIELRRFNARAAIRVVVEECERVVERSYIDQPGWVMRNWTVRKIISDIRALLEDGE